ncbi:hypothetical protein SLS62_005506 [Diatrype stigma]|uniref:FAD dependent oxidoreductase domain-containing protein n=1 Tax=Diatrype stigma TaxID=117547 RepID=A0AAN9YNH8_9PEZI
MADANLPPPQSSSTPPPSYIIVGAGVFGVSTAIHLAATAGVRGSTITLVDRDALAPGTLPSASRVAASWDWNKAVRADYADATYCGLALEAREVWRGAGDDPALASALSPFYHESGVYWISRAPGFGRAVLDNYRKFGRGREVDEEGLIELVPVDEARKLFGGVFDKADYEGVEKVLVNRTSGWADARGALLRGVERARELGVRLVTAEVEALEFGADGGCVGVKTREEGVIEATHTVLCTGSYTPKLLDESARRSGLDQLRAGGRIISAGVTTGLTVLDDEDMKTFEGMPLNIQENPPERGASNGSLPPNANKQLKWWGQCIFKNTQTMASGLELSAPPPESDYAQWNVPEPLKEDISFANKVTFGKKGESWKIEQHRICWEALTPSADFIVSPHSASRGLYVATCGSFHGWKFFPIIGKYVVQMLDGSLSPELQKKWAWDRELPDTSKSKEWPRKELKDLS